MKGQCPHCKARFKIDDLKIPAKGVYGKCPKCSERIFLSNTIYVNTNSEIQSGQKNSQNPSLKSKVATNSLQNNKTAGTQKSMSSPKARPKEKSVPLATHSLRLIRNIAAILGSTWFFFSSCIIGTIPGNFVAIKMSERKVEKGEKIPYRFKVVVDDNTLVRLDELESLLSHIKEAEDNIHPDSSSILNFFMINRYDCI